MLHEAVVRFKLSCLLKALWDQQKVLLECNLQAPVKRADSPWGIIPRLAIITGQVPSPGLGFLLPSGAQAEPLLARRAGAASFTLCLRSEQESKQTATRLTMLSPAASESQHSSISPGSRQLPW